MKIKLQVTNPGSQPHHKVWRGKELNLGRDSHDIRLEDKLCSRVHASLYEKSPGKMFLKDLESTNGTLVNGEKITETRVFTGDTLLLGDTKIVILDLKTEPTLVSSAKNNVVLTWPEQGELKNVARG